MFTQEVHCMEKQEIRWPFIESTRHGMSSIGQICEYWSRKGHGVFRRAVRK